MNRHVCVAGGLCALLACAAGAQGDIIDSGYVENTGDEPAIIFSTTVEVPEAVWLRLNFEQVLLSGNEEAGTGSYFRMTSVLDDAVQTMHASHVEQWLNASAFFNGDAVQFELIAYPGTGLNRVVIGEPTVGPGEEEEDLLWARAPCMDRRVLSTDPRVGRTLTAGGGPRCTAFIIDDPTHSLLTAGHCYNQLLYTVEFNVPLSDASGTPIHPPPEDQYAVDRGSRQWHNDPSGSAGDDWCYFGCFPNSTTGLTPFEAQGACFTLSSTVPDACGQDVRATGYGIVEESGRKTWNRVQATHVGEYYSNNPDRTLVSVHVDVFTGNSGGPLVLVDTCEVIGIVTDKACHLETGEPHTYGTAINNPGLQAALAAPIGACEPDCNNNAIPDRCDIDCGEPGGECDVSSCGLSEDCSTNGIPDECEPDCNTNSVPDACDIFEGTSTDCSGNGVPDECEPDCNSNGVPDDCDILEGTSDDCNCSQVPDECELAVGTSQDCNTDGIPDECQDDCNANGLADECDIAGGTSEDCASDGVPDECEWDCNTNGIADSCDILDCLGDPVCEDCNTNGRPDGCDLAFETSEDCNSNGVPDECDIAEGTSQDCHDNGIPDECESWTDCNTNGIPDECDIADGTSQDCNSNGIPDDCDIAGFGDLFVARGYYPYPFIGGVDQYDSATGAYVGEFVGDSGELELPQGVALDPNGGLLVGDGYLHSVQRYDGLTGDYLGDFVTGGAGGLFSPWDLVFAPDGDLLVANVGTNGVGTNGILKYDGDSGASLGVFASVGLEAPYGLTFGPGGDLFVCDYATAEIVRFDGDDGAFIDVFASSNGLELCGPSALAFDPVGGNLFVADADCNDVVEFDGTTGELVGVFIDDVATHGAASLMDLDFGPEGHLYVSHQETRSIYKYDESTAELLATLSSGGIPGKPFRMAFRPPLPDCNSNGIPESCELADRDADGDVDLFDFAGFQGCLASTNGVCLAAFDRSAPCGTIDLADYAILVSQLTGPSSGGGDGGGEGGGGGAGAGAGDGGGALAAPDGDGGDGVAEEAADEAPLPPPDPWTYLQADIVLELRPVGGEAAATVLVPDTSYEVHYQADYDRVNGYALFAVAASPGHGFAAGAPAPAGDWSATGNFLFVDLETDEAGGPIAATGYPDGYFRYQMAGDDIWTTPEADSPDHAGPQGHFCNVTTQGPGQLNLQLYAWWIDEVAYTVVDMETQASFVVVAVDSGSPDAP